jgi:hypothetical protein
VSFIARAAAVTCRAIHNERAVSGPNRPPPPSAALLYENFEELEPIRHGASLAHDLHNSLHQRLISNRLTNQQQISKSIP